MAEHRDTDTPQAFTINEVCALLSVSRTTVYRLIETGALRTVRILADRRIPASELRRILGEKPS